MDDLLAKLEESFLNLLAESYAQGYTRAAKRTGKALPDEFDALVLRDVGKAAGAEGRFFAEFRTRARQTFERASRGEFTVQEAYDRVFRDSQRIARTANSRMETLGTTAALGEGVVYVPPKRGKSAHVCPPDDVCHRLIMGRLFKASTLKANAYSNFGVPKNAWMPCVPLHPNCVHLAIPATRSQMAQLAEMGIDPNDIPDDGIYIG